MRGKSAPSARDAPSALYVYFQPHFSFLFPLLVVSISGRFSLGSPVAWLAHFRQPLRRRRRRRVLLLCAKTAGILARIPCFIGSVKSGVQGFSERMERSCYFEKLSSKHEQEGNGYLGIDWKALCLVFVHAYYDRDTTHRRLQLINVRRFRNFVDACAQDTPRRKDCSFPGDFPRSPLNLSLALLALLLRRDRIQAKE